MTIEQLDFPAKLKNYFVVSHTLPACENQKVNFVNCQLPVLDSRDPRINQNCLFGISNVVINGQNPQDFSMRYPESVKLFETMSK